MMSGGIASIELDRLLINTPRSHDGRVFDALARADQDDAVKVLILSGRKRFSAGADLDIWRHLATGNGQ